MKERIVILDHESHSVFIEDIDMDMIDSLYDGEEERYILSKYKLGEYWTWDYITSIQYIDDKNQPHEIDIDEIID